MPYSAYPLYSLSVFTKYANLTGTVLDVKGSAIPKASVHIFAENGGATDRTTVTDSQGRFTINNLPVGRLSCGSCLHGVHHDKKGWCYRQRFREHRRLTDSPCWFRPDRSERPGRRNEFRGCSSRPHGHTTGCPLSANRDYSTLHPKLHVPRVGFR